MDMDGRIATIRSIRVSYYGYIRCEIRERRRGIEDRMVPESSGAADGRDSVRYTYSSSYVTVDNDYSPEESRASPEYHTGNTCRRGKSYRSKIEVGENETGRWTNVAKSLPIADTGKGIGRGIAYYHRGVDKRHF